MNPQQEERSIVSRSKLALALQTQQDGQYSVIAHTNQGETFEFAVVIRQGQITNLTAPQVESWEIETIAIASSQSSTLSRQESGQAQGEGYQRRLAKSA